jgi:hypothetical protein
MAACIPLKYQIKYQSSNNDLIDIVSVGSECRMKNGPHTSIYYVLLLYLVSSNRIQLQERLRLRVLLVE